MYLVKYPLILILFILLTTTIFCQNGSDKSSSNSFSFEDAAVKIPSPASVHLAADGRFDKRFNGNIDYLNFLYEHYGQEMIDAYKARNYAPGKLLERMWDGEYAGKWLDAATRSAVNTGDKDLLAKVDTFTESLIKHQDADGYMGVQLPTDRELNDWEKSWDLWTTMPRPTITSEPLWQTWEGAGRPSSITPRP